MQKLRYGIDLGTRTNLIALYYQKTDESPFQTEIVEFGTKYRTAYPSYIYVDEEHILSGTKAYNAYLDSDQDTIFRMEWEPKILLAESGGEDIEIRVGNKKWHVSDLLAVLFHDLKEEADKYFKQLGVEDVIVGMPIDYPDRCKDVMVNALYKAGIYRSIEESRQRAYFWPEPVAASLTYAPEIVGRENVFMFDFGGGTLDLSIMDLHGKSDYDVRPHRVLAKGRFKHQGKNFAGVNIDFLMFELYANKVGRDQLYRAFTNSNPVPDDKLYDAMRQDSAFGNVIYEKLISLKEELSSTDSGLIPKRISYNNDGEKIELPRVIIERHELESVLTPILKEISDYIDSLFNEPKMMKENITKESVHSVYLVGGSSMIPCVRTMLEKKFGAEKVRIHQQSKATQLVVEGLAYAGYQMQFLKVKEEIVEDLVESDYGYIGGDQKNYIVLKHGTPVNSTRIDEDDPDQGIFEHVRATNKSSSFISVRITQNGGEIGTVKINDLGSGSYRSYYEIDPEQAWLTVRLYDRGLGKWLNKGGSYSRVDITAGHAFAQLNNKTNNRTKGWS